MPISPEEQKDLAKMHADLNKIRENAFDAMKDIARANRELLDACGYRNKTNEQAVASMFLYYLNKCNERIKEHLKKWPD